MAEAAEAARAGALVAGAISRAGGVSTHEGSVDPALLPWRTEEWREAPLGLWCRP